MAGQKAPNADGIKGPVRPHKGVTEMHSHSTSQDQLACAFGALLFASLSFGAALFPLIVA